MAFFDFISKRLSTKKKKEAAYRQAYECDWKNKTIDESFYCINITFWNEKTKSTEEFELSEKLKDEIKVHVSNWNTDKSLFTYHVSHEMKVKNGVFAGLWLYYKDEDSDDPFFDDYAVNSLDLIKENNNIYLLPHIQADIASLLPDYWGNKDTFKSEKLE